MALAWPAPSSLLRRRRLPGDAAAPGPAALPGAAPHVFWRELGVHVLLAAAGALLLHRALLGGAVRWQDDTKYFYYPLLATVAGALKAGRLPLWEPGIFGGYPLLADGEAGALYPLHLVALRLLDPPVAFVALRLVRFYLAGVFTYAFLRATGAGRFGGLVAGLAYMLSGFFVAQVVHENLDSGMVWLPLVLLFLERAVRAPGAGRYRLGAFAGVGLAMQALAVHVQVCVFTALAVFPYLAWRSLFPGPGAGLGRRLPGRLLRGAGVGAAAGAVAAGLAAAQVLPLLDLAGRSARGPGITAEAATINSVTPFRLLTVLFPHLLTRPDGTAYGYWVSWEVTVYVGLPTLLLALLALLVRRDRYVVFFAALALLALVLATGRYGPEWSAAVTERILGPHGLRSPGRFAFLWSFGVAVLAGTGATWLDRRAGAVLAGRWAGAGYAAVCALLGVGVAGLLLAVRAARAYLLAEPAATAAWLERSYLAFDAAGRPAGGAADIYRHLLVALDPRTPATTVWALSVVAGYTLLVLWPLLLARPARPTRAGLRALTVVAVAVPLLAAAERAHPEAPVGAISPRSDAAAFLRDRLAPPGGDPAARPLARVYTSQPVYLDHFDVEPNALLPLGVQEAWGYSSLSSESGLAYAWAAETTQGRLLDVWNVRYFLWPTRTSALPSYELTSFHPQRPLVSGSGANTGAAAAFRVPAVAGENVRVVATLRDAWAVPDGATVAWVVATDDAGERQRWPLRMGRELAEATAPPAAAPPDPTTPRPQAVYSWKEYGPDGAPLEARLYYAKLPLDRTRTIVRLAVRPVPVAAAAQPIFRLYGLGVGRPDWWVHCVDWFDRERFTPVYRDADVRLYRNERTLPRAYLVPQAVPLPAAQHLKAMAEADFDPERMLYLDPQEAAGAAADDPTVLAAALAAGGPGADPGWAAPTDGAWEDEGPTGVRVEDAAGRVARSAAGRAAVEAYAPERVDVRVEADAPAWLFLADSFDPGWRVTVDGVPRPIHRATARNKAFAVPAGGHTVAFRYVPAPLAWGAAATLVTGLVVLLLAGAGVVTALRGRRTGRPGGPSARP